MADQKADGYTQLLDAARKNPLQAWTLGAVIVGGAWMYFTVQADSNTLKKEIQEIQTKQESYDKRHDQLRDALGSIRGEIREIAVNVRWLAKQQTTSKPNPD